MRPWVYRDAWIGCQKLLLLSVDERVDRYVLTVSLLEALEQILHQERESMSPCSDAQVLSNNQKLLDVDCLGLIDIELKQVCRMECLDAV